MVRAFRTAGLLAAVLIAFSATANAEESSDASAAQDAGEAQESSPSEEPSASPAAAEEAPASAPAARQPAEDADGHPAAFRAWASQHAAEGSGEASSTSSWQALSAAELLTPTRSWPYVELHGYFRMRAGRQWHYSLGTEGTSPYLAPLDSMLAPGRSEGSVPSFDADSDIADFNSAWDRRRTGVTQANVSLALEPHIHLTETFKVVMELGLAESMRFGDGGRDLSSFTGGPTGRDGLTLQLTQAYATIDSFLGTFTVGRFRRHWGLGLVAHGGTRWSELQEARRGARDSAHAGTQCWDCDFATITDGLQWQVRAGAEGPRVAAGYTYHNSGALPPDIGAPIPVTGSFTNADERIGFYLQATNRAANAREAGMANRLYAEDNGNLFEWGAQIGWQRQELRHNPQLGVHGAWSPSDLSVWTPDLWMRWQSAAGHNKRFRLELEAASNLGSEAFRNRGQSNEDLLTDRSSQDIRQFGAALELEFQSAALSTGLNAGFATGRDMNDNSDPGFGIRDRRIGSLEDNNNTAFNFHPSYMVDRILFREIIGSVTNAIYAAPWFAYDFWSRSEDVLGMRLDLLFAFAANADSTPSGDAFYGAEPGLSVYYGEPRYRLEILSSVFIPGSAFAAKSGRPRNAAWIEAADATPVYMSDRNARAAGLLELRLLWAF